MQDYNNKAPDDELAIEPCLGILRISVPFERHTYFASFSQELFSSEDTRKLAVLFPNLSLIQVVQFA